MKHTIKFLAFAVVLALPTFFSANALAIPNCGNCAVGTAPASHVTFGVTNTTLCSTCHSTPAIPATPATPGKPTTPAIPATPALPGTAIYPTTHSCGACVIGSAPGSVSAHKNVNPKGTACAMCHISGSTIGTGGGTTGELHKGNDIEDHQDPTGVKNDGRADGGTGSKGNSDFGHSHKRDKKPHRDHDD
jgi:hypothetical protein